jgi:hypothetical protein
VNARAEIGDHGVKMGQVESKGFRSRAVWFGVRYGGAGTDGVGPTKSSPIIRMVKLEHDPEKWRPVENCA